MMGADFTYLECHRSEFTYIIYNLLLHLCGAKCANCTSTFDRSEVPARVPLWSTPAHTPHLYFLQNSPNSTQPHKLAPPLSTASISPAAHPVLRNLNGSSSRSKNSPSLGFTLPKLLPARPPIADLTVEAVDVVLGDGEGEEDGDAEADDADDEGAWSCCWRPPSGPCCWAFCR